MSVSKPFLFALVCETIGPEEAAPSSARTRQDFRSTRSRLRALKIGLLIIAGLALIAIIPAGRLPGYLPGEIPSDLSAAKA